MTTPELNWCRWLMSMELRIWCSRCRFYGKPYLQRTGLNQRQQTGYCPLCHGYKFGYKHNGVFR